MFLPMRRVSSLWPGWIVAVVLAVTLGCGKRGESDEGGGPSEPTPVATLKPDELLQNQDKHDGKWVIVIARITEIIRASGPDGREHAEVVFVGGGKRGGLVGEFTVEGWAQAPKIEDGVHYKVRGLFEKQNLWLRDCRILGIAVEELPPEAILNAAQLGRESEKYVGKRVQLKGTVNSGFPGENGGVVTIDAPNDGIHTCFLAQGEFAKVQKAGRTGYVEIKGVIEKPGALVNLRDCQVVKADAGQPQYEVKDIARSFADNPLDGDRPYRTDKPYRNKVVIVSGTVQAVEKGKPMEGSKIVFTSFRGSKPKTTAVTVTAEFPPQWNDLVGKVKAGDDVLLSGEFRQFQNDEVALVHCWLMTR